jgi:hypothetical protein
MTLRTEVATISFGAVNVVRNTFVSSGPFGEDSCKSCQLVGRPDRQLRKIRQECPLWAPSCHWFGPNPRKRSVVPDGRHTTKGVAGDRHMVDGGNDR